jgi:glyoxylase-like metal-dependent hydrolase (beta-lactamase superfamily II)
MTALIPLKFLMSNACLLRGRNNILIDTGSPLDLAMITRQLSAHGVKPNNLALIVLTHVHFDHAGTAAALQKQAKCPVAVHSLEKDNLEKGQNAPIIPIHPLGKMLMPFMSQRFSPASADILIEDKLDLSGYGVDAQVIFTPGHTPGSLSVLTSDGHAIVGDLIGGGWPLGQFQPGKPRYHYWASNLEAVKTSLKQLLAFHPLQIQVGHGGPLDGSQARAFFLGTDTGAE